MRVVIPLLCGLLLVLPGARARADDEAGRASERLLGLRESCYGGRRGAPLGKQALQMRERQIAAALHAHDAERVFRLNRRMLQGGADERRLLPGLIAAIEGMGQADAKAHAAVCASLLEALQPPSGEAGSEPSTSAVR